MTSSLLDIQITSGPSPSPSTGNTPLEWELFFARRALKLLKGRLGPGALTTLLHPDTSSANTYWSRVLAESAGRFQHASVTLTCHGLSTSAFLAWFGKNVPDLGVMQAAHPEHYINGTTVLETIGAHVSLFALDFQEKPDAHVVGEERDEEKYPVALCARGVLTSGEVVGHACHQMRDLRREEVAEGPQAVVGMECRFGAWMPAAVPAEMVEMQRRHLVVEWRNWIRAAYEDLHGEK